MKNTNRNWLPNFRAFQEESWESERETDKKWARNEQTRLETCSNFARIFHPSGIDSHTITRTDFESALAIFFMLRRLCQKFSPHSVFYFVFLVVFGSFVPDSHHSLYQIPFHFWCYRSTSLAMFTFHTDKFSKYLLSSQTFAYSPTCFRETPIDWYLPGASYLNSTASSQKVVSARPFVLTEQASPSPSVLLPIIGRSWRRKEPVSSRFVTCTRLLDYVFWRQTAARFFF